MHEGSFRAIVRSEIEMWFEKNRARFDGILMRIAHEMVPQLEKQIREGILERVGALDATERTRAVMLFEVITDFIRRHQIAGSPGAERREALLADIDVAMAWLSRPPSEDKPSP